MKPKWSIIVGGYTYRINLSLSQAFQIAESLATEVIKVNIKRQTSTAERARAAS
jgi:hypothetical protein